MEKVQFEIVAADRNYMNQLAPKLRASDVAEIAASSGQEPRDALLESLKLSDPDMCWVARWNRLPCAAFGANDMGNGIGGIWMLASKVIYRNKLDFMKKSREYLALMHTRYEYLTNFIDEEHLIARRWVQALGFIPVQRIEKYGHLGRPFIQYVSKRK